MTSKWLSGEFIDVCATSSGYALAVVDGLDVICYIASSASAEPVEVWRRTSTIPISYIRCACRTDTNEVRAIGLGTSTTNGALTAQYFSSTAQVSKGTAYGAYPVLLQFAGGDWIGYIARTSKTYTRWPFAGAEPAASLNPFTVAGTNLGMIQVVGSTVTWREFVPQTAATVGKPRTTTISSVVFQYPMVLSGRTVGLSVGPPTNTSQVIAGHDTTQLSTIFAMPGEAPRIAILADGTAVIVDRTAAVELPRPVPVRSSGYGRAALATNLPPWPDYNSRAAQGPNQLRMPWESSLTATGGKRISQQGGNKTSEVYEKAFERIKDKLGQPVNLVSVGATSSSGPAPPPPPLTQDADVLVGSDGSGFPNARLPIDNAAISVDVGTANQFEVVLEDTAVTPGTYGDATHVGQFTVDAQGRLTFAQDVLITASPEWIYSPLTNGDPLNPELIFDGNGDVILVPIPAP